ncbi:MAG: efflux RND transporter periplasmic adaptor subunit [Planctomycetota bacterium]|jgi:HlyD family secretion protein
MKKWIGFGVVVAGIGALWGYSATRPIPVPTAAVEIGSIRSVVEEEGRTRVADRFVVSTPVAGRVRRITLEEGDPVTRDQVLAEMDPVQMQARVDEAEAEIRALAKRIEGVEEKRPRQTELETARVQEKVAERQLHSTKSLLEEAKARAERARKEAERTRVLVRRGSATASDLDRAAADEKAAKEEVHSYEQRVKIRELEISTARLHTRLLQDRLEDYEWEKGAYREQISGLEAGLAALRDDLRRTAVTAPAGGVLLKRYRESEQVLAAGVPLMEIGELSRLEVEADFLSEDVAHMKVGMPAEIFGRALGDEVVPARIKRIYPAAFEKISSLGVEQQRVTVLFDVAAGALPRGDQYRVQVRVILEARSEVVIAPEGALFRAGGEWQVYRVEKNVARLRTVETGLRDGRHREIRGGVREGDVLVLHPDETIADGVRVEPLE